ncbi:translation initiation factor subunit k [Plasmopara halstedii]|uniref:Eukaryotic translation initiation factor 3 subunit K n=1 Tax=Plasmopara halstedii TaxID=4781 RepID=A0A0P1B1W1_PLAHL|nr:translation initiation factor subunit k [Plasmopara halstedii]CEG48674.1 translation initiation factor subunit k [Plasmopara halstedii]|eukprot:XP_024585043.1 translation initiation factor subunit k [Plasmopara halstedii]
MPAFQQQAIVDFMTTKYPTTTQQQLQSVHNNRGFCDLTNVELLEAYLAEQLQNKTVDIDANLALLKLYLVYPATANATVVAKILAKGIMAIPSTFFSGASTMIPENIREDAVVTKMLRAGFLLQSCLFEDYWKEEVALTKELPGFLDSVRAFILTAVSHSHSAISIEVLAAKINVSNKRVPEIVAAEKWTLADNVIQISPNEENQMQAKKVQENIEFEDVLNVIHVLCK